LTADDFFTMHNKLIIALDVETATEARRLFRLLGAQAGRFKVGSQLFTTAGPELVREIVAAGASSSISSSTIFRTRSLSRVERR
jgi:orotidine-5'-phosphate decarboxylase